MPSGAELVGRAPGAGVLPHALAGYGEWLRRHGAIVRAVQWIVVAAYAFLLIVPAFLPLPADDAHALDSLTIFAQWAFWGVWWPFVILSMFVAGRTWCGIFCPEGTLTEAASRIGLGRATPHWLRWAGWPFVAFATTTIFGQLVSVYQYPKAALLVLGGSTLAAIGVGLVSAARSACGAATCVRSTACSRCSRAWPRCISRRPCALGRECRRTSACIR